MTDKIEIYHAATEIISRPLCEAGRKNLGGNIIPLCCLEHHKVRGSFACLRVTLAKTLEHIRRVGKITKNMNVFVDFFIGRGQFNSGNNLKPVPSSDNLSSDSSRKAVMVGYCNSAESFF